MNNLPSPIPISTPLLYLIQCLFTELELKRLRRLFGHPSTETIYNILKRADLQKVDVATWYFLRKNGRRCGPCQIYAQTPRRFKFTLRGDN